MTLFGREVFPAGGSYSDFATADVNRDGAADLIAVNGELHGEISVLLGDGAGHFGPRSIYAAGKYPLSVVAADLNGDGFVDIVAGNTGSFNDGYEQTVSVLLGRGDGTFDAPTKLNTGGRPRAVAIADFTGDNKADILTVNSDDAALGQQLLAAGRQRGWHVRSARRQGVGVLSRRCGRGRPERRRQTGSGDRPRTGGDGAAGPRRRDICRGRQLRDDGRGLYQGRDRRHEPRYEARRGRQR